MLFTAATWIVAISFLALSYVKDKGKTKLALNKAVKSVEGILPQFGGIVLLISLMLAFVTPETIRSLVGSDTGILGMLMTSIVGAVTLVPGFIAFPLAKSLVDLGAGIPQIAVFVSSLMAVGVVTLPLEIRYFGRRTAVTRNVLAYISAFITAFVVGVVVS